MTDFHKLRLLNLVNQNEDLSSMTKFGFRYSQIVSALNGLMDEGIIEEREDVLWLTDEGLSKLDQLNRHFSKLGGGKWIEPLDSSRIKRLDIEKIYVPQVWELEI